VTARVSLVTPVLNGAPFIRATIESVLAQTQAPFEYVIVDGGSEDGTLDIARAYADRVRLITGPDGGQSDAIRKGFAATGGEFIGYLNADDTLLPGALETLATELAAHPAAAMVYGDALHVDADGRPIAPYPTRAFDAELLAHRCFIAQPATLIRRSAYDAVGGIDFTLQFAMDYDLWFRLADRFEIRYLPEVVATSRMYPANKTLGSRLAVYREIIATVRRRRGYVPYEWWAGYAAQLLEPSADQFFAIPRPTSRTALLALVIGLGINVRKPATALRDWLSHRSLFRSRT
jgi:glycosyltransferase involved in cell wall biosynthesis